MNPPVASPKTFQFSFTSFGLSVAAFKFSNFQNFPVLICSLHVFQFQKLSSFDSQLSSFPISKTFQFWFAAFKFSYFKNFPVLICSLQVFQFQKLSSFDLQLSSFPISKTFQFWFATSKFSNFKNFPVFICSFQVFQLPLIDNRYQPERQWVTRPLNFGTLNF